MTLRTLNYGNYGIFLIMGNAGFCPSAVSSIGLSRSPVKAQATPAIACIPRAGRLWGCSVLRLSPQGLGRLGFRAQGFGFEKRVGLLALLCAFDVRGFCV